MNIKKIKPLFTAVVVSAKVYPADYKEGNLLSPKANKLQEYQEVVAVGDAARGIEPGQLVCIDLSNYADWKYKKNSVKSDMDELTGFSSFSLSSYSSTIYLISLTSKYKQD